MQPDELLEQLIAIPSVTGGENQLALFCESFLQQQGFVTGHQPLADGRFNLLAQRGSGAALLLYAHHDTVAPAPDWEGDPFALRRDGERLIGLGASDMKGGIACLLAAAAASDAPVRIALGADEEAWSQGAWELVKSDWCRGAEAILVPELTIDSEQIVLGIGRRGHVAFEITTTGTRQHGAIPLGEPSAIDKACRLALDLGQLALPSDPRLGSETLVIRSIAAGSPDLTVPGTCRLLVSWLSLPGGKVEEMEEHLRQAAAIYGAEVKACERPTPVPAAYCLPEDHPLIARVTGLTGPLPLAFGLSVADENVLATLGLPVLSLAPVGGRSHRAGDWVSRSSLIRTTEIYTRLIQEW